MQGGGEIPDTLVAIIITAIKAGLESGKHQLGNHILGKRFFSRFGLLY